MTATGLTTTSGRLVDLLAPCAADVCFGDIAEQLAKENRFNGATPGVVYSVAEHLVRGSDAARDATASDLVAAYVLAHDFHEAFLKDDTTPKKRALAAVAAQFGGLAETILAAFASLTDRWDVAIHQAAGLPWPAEPGILASVHHFDRQMLATEWRDLMTGPPPYDFGVAPLAGTIAPWPWPFAKAQLLRRMGELLPGFHDSS